MNAKRWEIGLAGIKEVKKTKEIDCVFEDDSSDEGDESIQVGISEESREQRSGSQKIKRTFLKIENMLTGKQD